MQPRHVIARALVAVTPESAIRIAGLSVLQRTVFALERAGVRSIALVVGGHDERPNATTRCPDTRLHRVTPAEVPTVADGDALVLSRALVLDSAWVTAIAELERPDPPVLAIDTRDSGGGAAATGAYLIAHRGCAEIRRLLAGELDPSAAQAVAREFPRAIVATGVCRRVGPDAETALLRSLRKKTDGFFAYWFDRRLSTAISRRLVCTDVSPNQISVFTLLPALAAAGLIAVTDPLISGLGALLYWVSTILDGCDGEVARLKYLESAKGARLDLLCDNIGLVALFTGLVAHVHSGSPGPALLYAGAAIIAGMLAAIIIEYRLIARPRIRARGNRAPLGPAEVKRHELYERLASRDFAYLLPPLAFTGTLNWFVWATAIGVNVFWIALLVWVVRKRRSLPAASATVEYP